MQEFNLSITEAVVMFAIDGLSQQEEKACWAAKETLAVNLKVCEQTIYNTTRKLIKKGLLENFGKRTHRTTEYGPTPKWTNFINKIKGNFFDDLEDFKPTANIYTQEVKNINPASKNINQDDPKFFGQY